MLKTRMILACLRLLLTISYSLFTTPAAAQDPDDDPPVEKVKITIKVQNGSSDKCLIYKLVLNISGTGRDSMDWPGSVKEIDTGEVSTLEFLCPKPSKQSKISVKYLRGADRNPETGTLLEVDAVPNLKLSVWSISLQ